MALNELRFAVELNMQGDLERLRPPIDAAAAQVAQLAADQGLEAVRVEFKLVIEGVPATDADAK